MSTYTTAAEDAKKIRASLKAMGITSKQVSVTSSTYSGGSSIACRIKDLRIAPKTVEKVAQSAENIRRDHTGEILSGGNRFISVSYDFEARQALVNDEAFKAFKAETQTILDTLHDNHGEEVAPGVIAFLNNNYTGFQCTVKWDDSQVWHAFYNSNCLIEALWCWKLQGKF